MDIKDAFAQVVNGELWLHQLDIQVYSHGNVHNHEPKRHRKLLAPAFAPRTEANGCMIMFMGALRRALRDARPSGLGVAFERRPVGERKAHRIACDPPGAALGPNARAERRQRDVQRDAGRARAFARRAVRGAVRAA